MNKYLVLKTPSHCATKNRLYSVPCPPVAYKKIRFLPKSYFFFYGRSAHSADISARAHLYMCIYARKCSNRLIRALSSFFTISKLIQLTLALMKEFFIFNDETLVDSLTDKALLIKCFDDKSQFASLHRRDFRFGPDLHPQRRG